MIKYKPSPDSAAAAEMRHLDPGGKSIDLGSRAELRLLSWYLNWLTVGSNKYRAMTSMKTSAGLFAMAMPCEMIFHSVSFVIG